MYIPYPALSGVYDFTIITYLECYTVLFKGTYEELWARDIPETIILN